MSIPIAGTIVIGLLAALPASAQPAKTGGFVNANIAIPEGPQTLAVSVPVELFGDSGTLDIDDDIQGGTVFDVSAGLRRGRFVAGVGFSRLTTDGSNDFTASTTPAGGPGGFQRSVNGTTPILRHEERMIFLLVGATRSVSERFDLTVSGGPAFFTVTQEIPTSIVVAPFGASYEVSIAEVEESAIGLQATVDLNYMLHPRVGIGGLLRYAWGSVDVPNATRGMTVGGIHLGAGLRLRL